MKKKIIFDVDLSDINNFNEDLVIEILEILLNQDDSICRCQSCLEDIYALSLKKLEPRYHPNAMIEKVSSGYLSSQSKFKVNAEKEVQEAIKTVSNKPHH